MTQLEQKLEGILEDAERKVEQAEQRFEQRLKRKIGEVYKQVAEVGDLSHRFRCVACL